MTITLTNTVKHIPMFDLSVFSVKKRKKKQFFSQKENIIMHYWKKVKIETQQCSKLLSFLLLLLPWKNILCWVQRCPLQTPILFPDHLLLHITKWYVPLSTTSTIYFLNACELIFDNNCAHLFQTCLWICLFFVCF